MPCWGEGYVAAAESKPESGGAAGHRFGSVRFDGLAQKQVIWWRAQAREAFGLATPARRFG